MNERVKFLADYLKREVSFSELCERFDVSRKTGYKWVRRYEVGGVENLVDRSRAPLTHSQQVSDEVVEAVIACVGPLWTLRSEHCGHPDRPIVDTEIGVVDSEIAIVDAEIGVVDSEIADRV
jgi:hypothetical protein